MLSRLEVFSSALELGSVAQGSSMKWTKVSWKNATEKNNDVFLHSPKKCLQQNPYIISEDTVLCYLRSLPITEVRARHKLKQTFRVAVQTLPADVAPWPSLARLGVREAPYAVPPHARASPFRVEVASFCVRLSTNMRKINVKWKKGKIPHTHKYFQFQCLTCKQEQCAAEIQYTVLIREHVVNVHTFPRRTNGNIHRSSMPCRNDFPWSVHLPL